MPTMSEIRTEMGPRQNRLGEPASDAEVLGDWIEQRCRAEMRTGVRDPDISDADWEATVRPLEARGR